MCISDFLCKLSDNSWTRLYMRPYRYLHSSLCAYVMNLFNRVFAILLHTGNKTPPMLMIFYFQDILYDKFTMHLYLRIMSIPIQLKFWFSVFGLHLENMLIINFSFIRVAEGTLVQLIGCFRFRWYHPNTFRYLVLLEVVVRIA